MTTEIYLHIEKKISSPTIYNISENRKLFVTPITHHFYSIPFQVERNDIYKNTEPLLEFFESISYIGAIQQLSPLQMSMLPTCIKYEITDINQINITEELEMLYSFLKVKLNITIKLSNNFKAIENVTFDKGEKHRSLELSKFYNRPYNPGSIHHGSTNIRWSLDFGKNNKECAHRTYQLAVCYSNLILYMETIKQKKDFSYFSPDILYYTESICNNFNCFITSTANLFLNKYNRDYKNYIQRQRDPRKPKKSDFIEAIEYVLKQDPDLKTYFNNKKKQVNELKVVNSKIRNILTHDPIPVNTNILTLSPLNEKMRKFDVQAFCSIIIQITIQVLNTTLFLPIDAAYLESLKEEIKKRNDCNLHQVISDEAPIFRA